MPTKLRREPRQPNAADTATARQPAERAMRLSEFRQLVFGQSSPNDRVAAIGDPTKPDLLALTSALRLCMARSAGNTVEIPVELACALRILLALGEAGQWPSRKGRHARAGRRRLEMLRDVVLADRVLQEREARTPWETVFDVVSRKLADGPPPKTIESAYERAMKKLRDDPDFYRNRLDVPLHVVEFAASLPTLGP